MDDRCLSHYSKNAALLATNQRGKSSPHFIELQLICGVRANCVRPSALVNLPGYGIILTGARATRGVVLRSWVKMAAAAVTSRTSGANLTAANWRRRMRRPIAYPCRAHRYARCVPPRLQMGARPSQHRPAAMRLAASPRAPHQAQPHRPVRRARARQTVPLPAANAPTPPRWCHQWWPSRLLPLRLHLCHTARRCLPVGRSC